jgi:hypothetical protein
MKTHYCICCDKHKPATIFPCYNISPTKTIPGPFCVECVPLDPQGNPWRMYKENENNKEKEEK